MYLFLYSRVYIISSSHIIEFKSYACAYWKIGHSHVSAFADQQAHGLVAFGNILFGTLIDFEVFHLAFHRSHFSSNSLFIARRQFIPRPKKRRKISYPFFIYIVAAKKDVHNPPTYFYSVVLFFFLKKSAYFQSGLIGLID